MIFAPDYKFRKLKIREEYRNWLEKWLEGMEEQIEAGVVSSSGCMQGMLSELCLYGEPRTDWMSIVEDYLRIDGKCVSYSKNYGKLLWNFDSQWEQNTVHAVYYDWWISRLLGEESGADHLGQITGLVQKDGWIYNPEVSPTQLRTRMKSELLLSMGMGLEILSAEDGLDGYEDGFLSAIADLPRTPYVSAEFFRARSLSTLGSLEQMPAGIHSLLRECEIEWGYHDFSISGKTDDYMGTKKRTAHDKPISSPLITSMAKSLSSYSFNEAFVHEHLEKYADHLSKNPLDIEAFRMRDIEIPFGTSITPLEIVAASTLTS